MERDRISTKHPERKKKQDLILGGEILVANITKIFLVVSQVCTHLKRIFGPLVFT